MKRQISVPCYVRNGGVNNIVNIPMGVFMRQELKALITELLSTQKTLSTFCAAHATERKIKLLKGLHEILSLNLKPKDARKQAETLLTVNEKNLNDGTKMPSNEESVNLVSLAVSCGLIIFLFLVGAHVSYLEAL